MPIEWFPGTVFVQRFFSKDHENLETKTVPLKGLYTWRTCVSAPPGAVFSGTRVFVQGCCRRVPRQLQVQSFSGTVFFVGADIAKSKIQRGWPRIASNSAWLGFRLSSRGVWLCSSVRAARFARSARRRNARREAQREAHIFLFSAHLHILSPSSYS